jgi:hypothetical protein
VNATGAIQVQSEDGAGEAKFTVTGGNGSRTTDAGAGEATVKARAVSVKTNGDSLHDAALTISGGSGGLGKAGFASLSVDEDVDVVSDGIGNASIVIAAGDAVAGSTGRSGALATFATRKLTIAAAGSGDASVKLFGGDASTDSADDGSVTATITGDLVISGATDHLGEASFSAQAGDSNADGSSNGVTNLNVSGDMSITGGDAQNTDGGSASVEFMDARIGGDATVTGGAGRNGDGGQASAEFVNFSVDGILSVSSGLGTGSNEGGEVTFITADDLTASQINLTQASGSNLTFKAARLASPNNDIDIFFSGTDSTAARIDRLDVANGHILTFRNDNGGTLYVGSINIPDGSDDIDICNEAGDGLVVDDLVARRSTLGLVFTDDTDMSVPYLTVNHDTDITGSTIVLRGDGENLYSATNYTLIKSGTMTEQDDYDVVLDFDNQDTFSSEYGVALVQTPNGPVIRAITRSNKPATKALSEGKAAGAAFLAQGADLVAGDGVANAVLAAADAGPSVFSGVSYGHSRYETGSHVDVDGFSLLIGAAFGTDVSIGRFTVGAFFEYGNGSYDSYNDFATYSVDGSGDTDYVGGGLLARLEFAKSDNGTTYAEVTGRAGRISSDFASDNIWADRHVTYDVSSTYWGVHLGLGRIFNITDTTSLDLYGKWLYTHQGGDSAVIEGDQFTFDAITSSRLRAGIRITTSITDVVRPYFGVAYEHETDGKANASALGLRLDTPSLGGGTGIGELGLSVLSQDRFHFDIGIQGFVGQRQGVAGNIRFTYNF